MASSSDTATARHAPLSASHRPACVPWRISETVPMRCPREKMSAPPRNRRAATLYRMVRVEGSKTEIISMCGRSCERWGLGGFEFLDGVADDFQTAVNCLDGGPLGRAILKIDFC